MSEGRDKPQIDALLRQRAASAESTRTRLDQALNRFEQRELTKLPQGSKLTVRNWAVEAEVNKDTPLSRYPKGHLKAGEYRYPKAVARFRRLKAKYKENKSPAEEGKETEIQRLRKSLNDKDSQILKLAREVNKLDSETVDSKRRINELEKENARLREENAHLRQENIKIIDKTSKGRRE